MIKNFLAILITLIVGGKLFAQQVVTVKPTVTITTYSVKRYSYKAVYERRCGEAKPCWYDNLGLVQMPVYKSQSKDASPENIQAMVKSFENAPGCYAKALKEMNAELKVKNFSEYFYPATMTGQALQLRAISFLFTDGSESSTDCI